MRLKTIWMLAAIALAGMALAVSGCGGDGGSTTTTTVETDTVETDTTDEGTEDETGDEGSSTDSTDMSIAEFATSENCQKFTEAANEYSNALSGTSSVDPDVVAENLERLADEAPEEISDDLRVYADFYVKIAEAYEGYDPSSGSVPSPDVLAKLQQLGTEVDAEAVATASGNIATWMAQNCTNAGPAG